MLHHKMRRRGQQRRGRTGTLNLVSLMDIFTILVFFLMVNSSDVEILETSANIKLPESVSTERPQEQLVISVSQDALVVAGREVARIEDLHGAPDEPINGLQDALASHAASLPDQPTDGHAVTIMGDHELPYWLLKRIMLTCQSVDFARISLAVNSTGGAEA
jgi:biopolymer transport protein ExbD